MANSSQPTRRRKVASTQNLIPLRETSEFQRIHLPTAPLIKHFKDRFIDSYYVDIEDFRDLIVYGRSVRNML